MKSAEWIVIINKLHTLLNIDQSVPEKGTEITDNCNAVVIHQHNDSNQERTETVEIDDSDTEESKTQNDNITPSITGFQHGEKHKKGVARSKVLPVGGRMGRRKPRRNTFHTAHS